MAILSVNNSTGYKRYDPYGNIYVIPEEHIIDFDNLCDGAIEAEPDEAIGLWIDIKTRFKKWMVANAE